MDVSNLSSSKALLAQAQLPTEELQAMADSFATTAARFIEEQPLLASLVAVILVALVLYLLSKLAKMAMVAILVIAMIVGLLVYTMGPDQARSYLDQLREGPAAAEGTNR